MSSSWLPYLAVASLYPLASCWLLRRPLSRFRHAPRADPQLRTLRVRTSAHRGGAAEAPENTMRSFEHSAALGVDLFELDVHLTKDKQVVVYHDDTVDRVSEEGGEKGEAMWCESSVATASCDALADS